MNKEEWNIEVECFSCWKKFNIKVKNKQKFKCEHCGLKLRFEEWEPEKDGSVRGYCISRVRKRV